MASRNEETSGVVTADHRKNEMMLEECKSVKVEISRPVYSYAKGSERLDDPSSCSPTNAQAAAGCIKQCYCAQYSSFFQWFISMVPAFGWLPKYSWRGCLVDDVLAGVTVGIMAVSEGLAYAKLAGMPPISGLYTNIISSLVYSVLGTCRHAVFGPLASLALITNGIRYKYVPCENCWQEGHYNSTSGLDSTDAVTPIEIGSTVAFIVGCYLIIGGLLRLSFLTNYLSDQVVGGFTIGVAVHMLSGQLNSIFGVSTPKRAGMGKAIMGLVDLFYAIDKTNFTTLSIFAPSFAFLLVVKLFINPRIRRKIRFQLPAELLVISCATLATYYCQLHSNYGVEILGTVPAGLPEFTLPRFDLISTLWLDSLVPAVVTYSLCISFAKLFQRRNAYKVDPTQEFYAYGAVNLLGSFFQCINAGQSMARSIVNERSGAVTLISTFVSALVGLFVLLVIASFLEWLPNCILSSIVVTACVLICCHITEVRDLYRRSKIDLSIYVVTALAVCCLDIPYGLIVGALWALLTVVLRSQTIRVLPMDTQIALLHRSPSASPGNDKLVGLEIVEIRSPIFYANAENMRAKLMEFIGRDGYYVGPADLHPDDEKSMNENRAPVNPANRRFLILDVAGVPFMDSMGVNALKEVRLRLKECGMELLLAGCAVSHHHQLQTAGFFGSDDTTALFPTLADAISFASDETYAYNGV